MSRAGRGRNQRECTVGESERGCVGWGREKERERQRMSVRERERGAIAGGGERERETEREARLARVKQRVADLLRRYVTTYMRVACRDTHVM